MTLGSLACACCRAAALACVLVAVAACTAAEGASPEIRLRRLDGPGDARTQERDFGRVELLAAYELSGLPRFGGISALLLDRESSLLLLSDRARLFRARRVEDSAGRLLGLRDWTELPLPGPLRDADTEALARHPDGGIVIAAEGEPRLFRLANDSSRKATPIPLPGFLRDLPANEGIEALAALPDGRLLAVSEGGFEQPGVAVAGLVGAKEAVRLGVGAPDGFRPTGADVAGNTLFLLERRVSLLGGLEARLVAVPLDGAGVGDATRPLDGTELVRLGAGSFAENFEGVAVRRTDDGRYLIYLVADNNFSALQRTLLLQFAWRDPASVRSERR